VLVALPSLLFGSVDSTAGAVLQAKLRMDLVAVADFVAQVGGSLLTVALVVAHAGFYAIVAVVVVTSGAHAILVFGFARRRMGLAPGVNLVVWRRLFVTALPLGVALVLNMIYVRIDVLLLSLLSGSAEVGLYGVGARFVEVAIGFPALFFAAVFPVLAGAAGVADLERLRAVAQRAFDVLVLAAVPFVLGSLLTAPEIVRLLAGGGFSGATTPLRVLSIGGGLVFVNGMLSYLLIALGRQKATFFLNLGMVTLNVGLNLVLIPRYGAVGAAWATTVSEVSILAGCSWMARSFAGFTPSLRVAWRAGLAGALMAGAVAALGAGLAASVALGAVAYGLVLAVLRVPQVLELRRLVLPHAAGRP
jgi:O-antigen/teichoic acid export membrane protein